MKVHILVYTIGLFYSCNAQQQEVLINDDANTLLWEISGNALKKPSYLFGTFHLLCEEDAQFSQQLKTAIKNTQELYLEMDMDDPATLLGGLMLMNMKGGKKLKDLYNTDEYQRIEFFFKDSLQISLLMFQQAKPYFLAALIYPRLMPCNKFTSIEEELLKLAKAEQKEIKGLETMAFQAALFDSIPYEKQAMELLNAIDSTAVFKQYFDTMLTVYKNQQLDKIETFFNNTTFGIEDNEDILLYNRNKNWVKQLHTIIKNKSVFVAVGAGHLVGEQGLIALLRKEGYTIRPLKNK